MNPVSDERIAVVAYIRDRAGQYDNGCGIVAALEEIGAAIEQGEHVEAFRHGELDDLIGCRSCVEWDCPTKAVQDKK